MLAFCLVLIGTFASGASPVSAQDGGGRLLTNEAEVAALAPSPLAIDDPVAVFAFVLGQLPARVRVFPTENYYYFRFTHNGVAYAGNIRLAAKNRDQGEVNFAYGEPPSDWNDRPRTHHAALGAPQGVTVEKVESLVYRVSHGGKSVTFALNDLSRVRPPPGLLGADEKFIGPVFDESGIRFFLVFNARLKIFHYILDETEWVADQLDAAEAGGAILVGKRTGFAFYQYGGRKILVGVSAFQSLLNTYFDGPFDQLPENFIEGESLREAILAVTPALKGRIDRLGNFIGRDSRYLIHPYLPYRQRSDLAVFHRCATAKSVAAAQRPRCFVIEDEEAQRDNALPLPLMQR